MKRLLYTGSLLALVGSMSIVNGRTPTFASHQAAPAQVAVKTFRLCSSAPLGVPPLFKLVQGIFNGVRLATFEMQPKFRKAGLNLASPLTLDDAAADGTKYDTGKEIVNARHCLSQRNTIGYVGTLNSGAAVVSEPILNRGNMVMISPANTATSLTCPKPAVRRAQEPSTYNHRLRYPTYYRTLTTDALQGPSDAEFFKNVLHVSQYYLIDDKQTYGVGLAATFDAQAGKLGLRRIGFAHVDPNNVGSSSSAVADAVAAAHPQAVFYGGDSETGLVLPRLLRAKGFTGPIMGGDAIVNSDWIKASPRGAVNNYGSIPGPDIQHTGAGFRAAYQRRFHVPLQTYEATSYDAAKIILQAVLKAHAAGRLKGGISADRKAILPYVAATRYYGATGLTTFDHNGDTTNRKVSVYAVVNGVWTYKQLAPKSPGALPTKGC